MDEPENRAIKAGSTILEHEVRERELEPPDSSRSVAEDVERHMASVGLEVVGVLHEVISDLIDLDVHVCPPSDARPFYTLFTTGMADLIRSKAIH